MVDRMRHWMHHWVGCNAQRAVMYGNLPRRSVGIVACLILFAYDETHASAMDAKDAD